MIFWTAKNRAKDAYRVMQAEKSAYHRNYQDYDTTGLSRDMADAFERAMWNAAQGSVLFNKGKYDSAAHRFLHAYGLFFMLNEHYAGSR